MFLYICLTHGFLCRSVVRVMDPVGKIQNFYKYDPFGNILEQSEDFFSTFAYVGRLGVIRHKELQNLYHMRARFYDAQHGCFISLDPLGTLCILY